MDIATYRSLDGLAMADLVRRGQVRPQDLMECAVALAKERGSALNAISYERYEESCGLAESWVPHGVFQGIPFLLKDSGLASTRFPSSLGSRLFNDTRYAADATLVQRFDQAGFIPFARTTVPELCMAPATEAVRNGGPTLNPLNVDLSTGGSSGGAAAAVAAGVVPIAHGSDGGGSIRIPAACCGLYGLKPSRGRVPIGPFRGEGWGGLATDGVLSRSVRDTAAAMDVISGYEIGAPYAAPSAPKISFLDSLEQPFGRPLRVGVWREAWNGITVAPECLLAVDHAVSLCKALGHQVIDTPLPEMDFEAFRIAHTNVLAANVVISVDAKLALLKRALADDDLEPAILSGYEQGQKVLASDYVKAINLFHSTSRIMASAISGFDVILTPTLTGLPAKLGEFAHKGCFSDFREKVAHYATFLAIVNASGQPAASLPLYWTSGGLPVSIQLIGAFAREDVVLRLSAQLERAAPWIQRLLAV